MFEHVFARQVWENHFGKNIVQQLASDRITNVQKVDDKIHAANTVHEDDDDSDSNSSSNSNSDWYHHPQHQDHDIEIDSAAVVAAAAAN
jgi:hypothetical protein